MSRLLVLLVFVLLSACSSTTQSNSLDAGAEESTPSTAQATSAEVPLVLMKWEICKQGAGITGTECQTSRFPKGYWGPVEDIALFARGGGAFVKDSPGIYVRSRGCLTGGDPQELGWYSADATTLVLEGQTAEIRISEMQELDEMQTGIYMQTYANAPGLISGVPCTPLPENAEQF